MRRLIEAVDAETSKTKVDEALPLVGAGLAAGARLAAPYLARAGSAIMKGLRGSPKPPATPPKPPVTPPVTTPAGSTPPIPANVNIPAAVRNKPAAPPAGSAPTAPPSAPASPATAGAKPPAKTDAAPAVAKPKIERRPGETTADAVKRAQAEKGIAPKPTAPAAPKPAAGEKPAVWRDPRTGEVSSTPPGAGRPAAPRPAEPAAPKPAASKDPVGSARPGGERDTLGRREPGSVDFPEPGEPLDKKGRKGIKRAAAASAALHLGGAYLLDKFGNKIPKGSIDPERQPVGGAPSGEQTFKVNLYKPSDSELDSLQQAPAAAAPTGEKSKIDLPRVGPQGPDSPFYVVPDSSPEKAPDAAAAQPAPDTKKSTSTTPSTTAGGGGAGGSGGSVGASTGAGSEDEQIERNLRRMGVINETLSQRLLNDFINYIESNSKSKAK